jgi:hypothetical protein
MTSDVGVGMNKRKFAWSKTELESENSPNTTPQKVG